MALYYSSRQFTVILTNKFEGLHVNKDHASINGEQMYHEWLFHVVVLIVALLMFPFCRLKDYQKLRYMTIMIIGTLVITIILLII